MQAEHDGIMLVRAELCERLEVMRHFAGRRSEREFAANISGIRRLATAYGFKPVALLAEALERAVAESDSHTARSCPTALYFDRLHDAIGCGRSDDQASEAMLASVSVRMSG